MSDKKIEVTLLEPIIYFGKRLAKGLKVNLLESVVNTLPKTAYALDGEVSDEDEEITISENSSREELEEAGLSLGLTMEQMKKCRKKADLFALIQKTNEEGQEEGTEEDDEDEEEETEEGAEEGSDDGSADASQDGEK